MRMCSGFCESRHIAAVLVTTTGVPVLTGWRLFVNVNP